MDGDKIIHIPTELYSDTLYTYHLKNTNNDQEKMTTLISAIEPYTMDLLIAYIQYQSFEIHMRYSINKEIIKLIIKNHYQIKVNHKIHDITPYEINLSTNFKKWDKHFDDILEIKIFEIENLHIVIQRIVFSLHDQVWEYAERHMACKCENKDKWGQDPLGDIECSTCKATFPNPINLI